MFRLTGLFVSESLAHRHNLRLHQANGSMSTALLSRLILEPWLDVVIESRIWSAHTQGMTKAETDFIRNVIAVLSHVAPCVAIVLALLRTDFALGS